MPTIYTLPEDIQTEILLHLDLKDLVSFWLCKKRQNKIFRNKEFKRRICLRETGRYFPETKFPKNWLSVLLKIVKGKNPQKTELWFRYADRKLIRPLFEGAPIRLLRFLQGAFDHDEIYESKNVSMVKINYERGLTTTVVDRGNIFKKSVSMYRHRLDLIDCPPILAQSYIYCVLRLDDADLDKVPKEIVEYVNHEMIANYLPITPEIKRKIIKLGVTINKFDRYLFGYEEIPPEDEAWFAKRFLYKLDDLKKYDPLVFDHWHNKIPGKDKRGFSRNRSNLMVYNGIMPNWPYQVTQAALNHLKKTGQTDLLGQLRRS